MLAALFLIFFVLACGCFVAATFSARNWLMTWMT